MYLEFRCIQSLEPLTVYAKKRLSISVRVYFFLVHVFSL